MSATTTAPATPPRTSPPGRSRALLARRTRDAATSYALLMPALVLFGVFLLYPLVQAVRLSLTDAAGISDGVWIGLQNYSRMMSDPVFWRAALNTVLLAVVSVPLALGLGLGLALLLQRRIPARALFRTVFLAPVVISGVVTALAGRFLFDENVGMVNLALESVGLDPVRWQSQGGAAAVAVLLMLTWSRTGLAVVIYLGGLQNLDPALDEAAMLDGASRWQRLRFVTLPQLRPTTFFLTVIMVIETFQVFDLVYVMTGGGPGRSTELVITYAYAAGFESRQIGYGSALGVVVFAVVLVATAVWWRVQQRHEADQ